MICSSADKMVSKTYASTFMIVIFMLFADGRTIVNETVKLEAGPLGQNVKVGQNVTLQCRWSKRSPNCVWIKDESSVIISENDRYTVTADNKTRTCSLKITGIQATDEGNWQCAFSKEDDTMISKPVKLVVDDTDVRHLLDFKVIPENSTAINGKDVTLECKFTTSAPLCFWTKDNEVMAIRSRYNYAGDRFKGDCSIRINKANLLDDGIWCCGYPRSDTEPMLKSLDAKLSVYVTPSEPVIVVNGIPIEHNEKIFISTLNKPPKISCWSENGKPATDMQWRLPKLDTFTFLIPVKPPLISDSVQQGLKISELPFSLDFNHLWQQMNLTCVATHPSYDDDHSTSVHLILGSEIITSTLEPMDTTTKSMQCLVYGFNC